MGHGMPMRGMSFSRWLAGGAVAGALLLSGCADGVDLNGKVFDWMGVSPAAQEARRNEPKLAERAPLVVPPDVSKLPEPGSERAPGQVAWPNDPEQRKLAEAKERERLHLAYCRGEIQWKERALNKDNNAPRSPYGPCPGLFGGLISGNVNKE
jgi:hypothetical protein